MVTRLLLVLALQGLVFANQGGLSLSIDEGFINTVGQYLAILGVGALQDLNAGNFSASIDLGGMSGDANITDLTISNTSLDFMGSSLTVEAPNLLRANLSRMSTHLDFGLSMNVGIGPMAGQATLDIDELNLSVGILVYKDSNESLSVDVQGVDFSFKDMTFNSTINLFITNLIQNFIDNYLTPTELESLIRMALPAVNNLLESIPYDQTLSLLGTDFGFNLHPSSNATVSGSFYSIGINGAVTNATDQEPFTPYEPSELPKSVGIDYPIQAFLSEYAIKSLLLGVPYLEITSLPKSFPIKLTTDGIKFLIPELQEKYGSGKKVKFVVTPDHSKLSMQIKNNMTLTAPMELGIWVQDGDWIEALDLELTLDADLWVKLLDSKIRLFFNKFSMFDLSYKNSKLDNFDWEELKELLIGMCRILISQVNSPSSSFSFELPKIPYVKIKGEEGYLQDNYMVLGINAEVSIF